jgi:hypothetical protein
MAGRSRLWQAFWWLRVDPKFVTHTMDGLSLSDVLRHLLRVILFDIVTGEAKTMSVEERMLTAGVAESHA